MHNIVLSRFVKAAVVLVAAVALLPASVLGQGAQGEKYQLRRLAGHGLYARDYPAEAFFILEELGDNALASGDTAGAIQAYHDAAWIAGQAAKEADAMFDPKTIGVGVDYRPKAAAQEAQRILEKAMAIGGSGTAELAPLTLDRDLEDREVGMEIGRVLYAIERPYLSTLVFEIVGDQALASGNNPTIRNRWGSRSEPTKASSRSPNGWRRRPTRRQASRRHDSPSLVVPQMEPRGC
jgi:hypothetical protein